MAAYQELINNNIKQQELANYRQNKIREIEQLTNRPLIVYASKINSPRGAPNSIDISDIEGFSDLIDGITGSDLDILINSPGGTAEAVERIVRFLRKRFKSIHYFVPHSAYSAATMLCLSGNRIYMDSRSCLGPIDPQIGGIPAQEILDAMAEIEKKLSKNPEHIPAYLPMLQKYDLHLFRLCKSHIELGKRLVSEWLSQYMFNGQKGRQLGGNIRRVMSIFAIHSTTLSHNRSIGLDVVKTLPLKDNIIDMDEDGNQSLQKKVWELYCSVDWLFVNTSFVKLFENSRGISWGRMHQERGVPLIKLDEPQPPNQPKP
ncbi:MAG: hypothetical protein A2W23_05000 [Planctomycetes bacterium RBG_16_43_13]|nr:MAG: hypothetical protein A2W23_05000 [Planctomycetes bacterium RBG_16_43_13]